MRAPAEDARVRAATAGDISAVLVMMRQLYEEDGGRFDPAPAERAVRQLLDDPSLGAIWVVEEAGGPCGYAVLTLGYCLEFHGHDAFVDELFVSPGHRGRGLGGRALSALEAECRRRGVRALHLEVTPTNEAALALYRRQGFELRPRQLMTRLIEPFGGRAG